MCRGGAFRFAAGMKPLLPVAVLCVAAVVRTPAADVKPDAGGPVFMNRRAREL